MAPRASSCWSRPPFDNSKPYRRYRRILPNINVLALFVFLFLVLFLVSAMQLMLPTAPPLPDLAPSFPCRDAMEGYILQEMGICTDACGKLCFPRVHGICFSHSEITVCDGQPPIPQDIISAWGGLPSEMRFFMEKPRMKVPLRHGACPGWNASALRPVEASKADWIHGLQMVADLTLMPTGRVGPNPHHEAEKIVPSIVFSQLEEFKNSSLYWFANPKDPLMISKWSLGLLDAFSSDLGVKYLESVGKNDPPVCFEDAILFSGVTNSGYLPNKKIHDWFRGRVLDHCKIPAVNANKPVQDVVIVNRPNSSRSLWNYEAVKESLEWNLKVRAKMAVPGSWDFCDQVRLVAEADVVLTPHGSQNANLITMRPGAVVVEVFPLLYYIDWYGHYLHAGRVRHYELYGTWPSDVRMPLLTRVYSYLYGWRKCFFNRRCMNYGKSQRIYVDITLLDSLLDRLVSQCHIVVHSSNCLSKSSPFA